MEAAGHPGQRFLTRRLGGRRHKSAGVPSVRDRQVRTYFISVMNCEFWRTDYPPARRKALCLKGFDLARNLI
jgi:hypothetical protein